MDTVAIGALLKQLRTDAGLTQEEMAEKLGLSQTYLSQVERGVRSPSWKILARYAGTVGVSVVSVLRGAGLLDDATENLEDEIAELVSQVPGFATLFEVAKDLYGNDPREFEEVVRYAQWRLERARQTRSTE